MQYHHNVVSPKYSILRIQSPYNAVFLQYSIPTILSSQYSIMQCSILVYCPVSLVDRYFCCMGYWQLFPVVYDQPADATSGDRSSLLVTSSQLDVDSKTRIVNVHWTSNYIGNMNCKTRIISRLTDEVGWGDEERKEREREIFGGGGVVTEGERKLKEKLSRGGRWGIGGLRQRGMKNQTKIRDKW